MAKCGENIHKRKDGRWEARYRIGVGPSGKIKYGSVYAKTYREVKAKRIERLNAASQQVALPRDRILFSQVADRWMDNNRLRLKHATQYRYQTLLDSHIIPYFGGRRIHEITATEINEYLASKIQCGRLDGKGGLAPSYIRSIMLIINSVISYAVANQLRQPLQTKICKPQIPKREMPILTLEQQKLLVSQCCAQPSPTALGVLLSLYAGMRIGEVCALAWSDIDFPKQIVHIRKTVTRTYETTGSSQSVLSIGEPKTLASYRDVPLSSWLAAILRQEYERRKSSFVVSTMPQFVSPRTYDYRFHRLLAKVGISDINYHALRHTFATRCIEVGTDVKSLSEMLGHANAAVTLNIYVHPSMDIKRLQVEKLSL